MICKSCGFVNSPHSTQCVRCGAPLTALSAAAQQRRPADPAELRASARDYRFATEAPYVGAQISPPHESSRVPARLAAGLGLVWIPLFALVLTLGWLFLWPMKCPNCEGTGHWTQGEHNPNLNGLGLAEADKAKAELLLELGYLAVNKGDSCLACGSDGKLTPYQWYVVYPRRARERNEGLGLQRWLGP